MQVDISEINTLTGDRQASIRLYQAYRKQHRDQSAQWIVEKVVADLERDRGVTRPKRKIRVRTNRLLGATLPSEWLYVAMMFAIMSAIVLITDAIR